MNMEKGRINRDNHKTCNNEDIPYLFMVFKDLIRILLKSHHWERICLINIYCPVSLTLYIFVSSFFLYRIGK